MTVVNFLKRWRILIVGGATLSLLLSVALAWAWNHHRAKSMQLLLETATAAEQAGDWAAAESALRRYAHRQGDTADICRRIGQAIERGATTEPDRLRAVTFYGKALSLAPQDDAVRLQFAELQVEDNPLDSLRQAETVLQRIAEHPVAWRVKALALGRLTPRQETSDSRLAETYRTLTQALRYQPGHLRLASRTAEFSRQHARRLAVVLNISREELERSADEVMDRLVAQAEEEGDARLARLLYRRQAGLGGPTDPTTAEDLLRLVELRPASNVVRLLAAGQAVRQAFPEGLAGADSRASDQTPVAEAKQHLTAAIGNRAEDPLPYWSLAQLQWWCGEREATVATLEQGLQAGEGDNLVLTLRLAETRLALGHWTAAAESLRQLEKPEVVQQAELSLQSIVDLLWVQWYLGAANPEADPERALALLERYSQDGLDAGLRGLSLYLRGLAYAELDHWDQAAAEFAKAVQATDANELPRLAHAHALYRTGRYREAAAQYRHALPRLARTPGRLNENQVWIELARCELAEQALRPAWKRDWRICEEALAGVRSRLAGSTSLLFLDLEAALLRDEPAAQEAAEARLSEAAEKFAKQPSFWESLARYRLRTRKIEAALTAIQKWEEIAGLPAYELQAEAALAQGDDARADELLAKAAQAQPVHQQRFYLTRRVENALRMDQPERARSLLKDWLDQHPKDVAMHYQRAQVAWSQGDEQTLADVATTLQTLEGKAGRGWRLCQTQGMFLKSVKQPDPDLTKQLVAACDDLVTRFPDDHQSRVLEALMAETQGDTRRAIRAWRQAIRCGEQTPSLLLRLASLLHESGQSREALELCLTGAADSLDYRPLALAAQILTTGSVDPTDQRHAEDLFRQALEQEPRTGLELLLLDLAVLREYQGQPDEAIALTQRALKSQPEAVELQNNLAWFLAGYKNAGPAALDLIERAIAAVGPYPSLLDTKGVSLLAAGRSQDAIRTLEESVQSNGVPATRWLHLAEAYRDAEQPVEARKMLDKAEAAGLRNLAPRDRRAVLKLKATLPTTAAQALQSGAAKESLPRPGTSGSRIG